METMPYDEPQVEVSAEDVVQIPYTEAEQSPSLKERCSRTALS